MAGPIGKHTFYSRDIDRRMSGYLLGEDSYLTKD